MKNLLKIEKVEADRVFIVRFFSRSLQAVDLGCRLPCDISSALLLLYLIFLFLQVVDLVFSYLRHCLRAASDESRQVRWM